MNIGDLFLALRGDGAKLTPDVLKAATAAGDAGGKTLGTRMVGAFKKSSVGIMDGLKIGAGIQAFSALDTAISTTIGFLGDAVQAARDDEESQNRLAASLKANVPGWNGNTDAIERYVLSAQRLGFTDETVRDSLTVLVGATHDVAKAQQIMAVAMDLARFKGIDLRTASEALIKVEGGHYKALAQLGIKLKDGATTTEALAEVEKVAAGQAEAFAKTNEGHLLASQIKVNEAMEDLGRTIMPLVNDGMVTIADLAASLIETFVDLSKTAGDLFGPFMDSAKPVIDTLSGIADGVDHVGDELNKVADDVPLLGKPLEAVFFLATLPARPLMFLKDRIDDITKSSEDAGPPVNSLAAKLEAADAAAADTRETNKILAGSIKDIGDVADDTADTVVDDYGRMQKAAAIWQKDLLQDATDVVHNYYDVITTRDDLMTTNSEINAQKRVLADKNATDAQKREATIALHKLEADRAELEAKLAEHGDTQSKAFKDTMKTLLEELAKAHGAEKLAIEAEIRRLQLLAIQAKITEGKVLSLEETIAATLAKGGYINASGVTPQHRAGGGVVEPGQPYIVGESGPEIYWPDARGKIDPWSTLRNLVAPFLRPGGMGALAGAGASVTNIVNNTVSVVGEPKARDPLGVARQLQRLTEMGGFTKVRK